LCLVSGLEANDDGTDGTGDFFFIIKLRSWHMYSVCWMECNQNLNFHKFSGSREAFESSLYTIDEKNTINMHAIMH